LSIAAIAGNLLPANFFFSRGFAMPYTADLVDELNTLIRFDLTTTQQGFKVHKNAEPALIAATRRLHDKGLLSQVDGGYLTSLGREVAEHAQSILTILTSGVAVQ